jgi:very-short-patch-repair endonuclease
MILPLSWRPRPEATLWRALRERRLEGLEFGRDVPFGPYVFAFYCPAARLAVEIDSPWDPRRNVWLAALGVRVLRFTTAEVRDEAARAGVLAAIAAAAGSRPRQADAWGSPSPQLPRASAGRA